MIFAVSGLRLNGAEVEEVTLGAVQGSAVTAQNCHIGRLSARFLVVTTIDISGATFAGKSEVKAASAVLNARNARFDSGLDLRLAFGAVDFAYVKFGAPSSGAPLKPHLFSLYAAYMTHDGWRKMPSARAGAIARSEDSERAIRRVGSCPRFRRCRSSARSARKSSTSQGTSHPRSKTPSRRWRSRPSSRLEVPT